MASDPELPVPANGDVASEPPPAEEEHTPPPIPPVRDVDDLDWEAIRTKVLARRAAPLAPGLLEGIVDGVEAMLASPPSLMFDDSRADEGDRAIHVRHEDQRDDEAPLWFIGDLHGDLLALEAAISLIDRESGDGERARIVFLGDLFDDGGDGLGVLLRVLERVLSFPSTTAFILGNHEEGLGFDGERFVASVSPSDFSDMLNARRDDAALTALGTRCVQFFDRLPRALFLPDGLLVTHGGFPLADLHEELRQTSAWNDPHCLSDFTWTRAHPRARKKIPNRLSRGSQFGYEDFAAFCALSTELGRAVTHMVRGHDHVDERFAIYPAYATTPVLTTVALSRRLPRETFGPYARFPTIARWVRGALPQVHRLHVPASLVCELYPEGDAERASGEDGGTVE